jgi:hypothetical protein
MALKHEAVVDNWNVLVIAGAGRGKQVLQQIESMIKETNMPGVILQQRDVSSGLFGSKRNFLVAGHNNLRDYHMYIGARDFGTNLDVSWYLTIEPGPLKRAVSKYTMGNPQALSMQIDFFSQQDLSAFVTGAHYCVKETVRLLMEELKQDPTGLLNTKSKGFLSVW